MVRFGGSIYGIQDYRKILEMIQFRFRSDSKSVSRLREFIVYDDDYGPEDRQRMHEASLDYMEEGLNMSCRSARQGDSDFLEGHLCRDI